MTYPIWQAIAARQQAFAGLFAWGGDTFSLSNGGEIRTAKALWVTGICFPSSESARLPDACHGGRRPPGLWRAGAEPCLLAARVWRQPGRVVNR